jgi:nucleoside-diphosphate-sugar epimerase
MLWQGTLGYLCALMESKRVLVTGAGGFIGRYLQEEGLSRGHEVYGSYRSPAEEELIQGGTKGFYLEFSERDKLIKRLEQFAKDTGGFEYVIHCAGITKPDRMEEFFKGNVEFTEFFINALLKTQPLFKKFIFISSLQAIGPGDPVSMQPINELTPPNPFTPYGISKFEAEKRIMAIEGLDWIIFRPTSVYGPRDTKFIHQIIKLVKRGIALRVGPKGQLVSFIYVKDLARALWDAVEKDVRKQIYCISDGTDYDPSDVNVYVARHLGIKTRHVKLPKRFLLGVSYVRLAIARLLKKPLHVSPFKIREITSMNWRVDNTKLKTELNFEPKFTLETGILDALTDDGFVEKKK